MTISIYNSARFSLIVQIIIFLICSYGLTFKLKPKDKVYLFSDGITDQLGLNKDKKVKKFSSGAFKKYLASINDKNISLQKDLISRTLKTNNLGF